MNVIPSFRALKFLDIQRFGAYCGRQFGELKDEASQALRPRGSSTRRLPRDKTRISVFGICRVGHRSKICDERELRTIAWVCKRPGFDMHFRPFASFCQ